MFDFDFCIPFLSTQGRQLRNILFSEVKVKNEYVLHRLGRPLLGVDILFLLSSFIGPNRLECNFDFLFILNKTKLVF